MERVTRVLIDDITGEEGATTHKFTIEGEPREIDLVPETWSKMQADLQPWMDASRPARGGRPRKATVEAEAPVKPSKPRKPKAATKSSPRKKEVPVVLPSDIAPLDQQREWAANNNWDVPKRGRIRQEIRDAFNEAHVVEDEAAVAV